MTQQERMSPIDTTWLRMDRPGNLMQILGVLLFDGKLDFARLRRTIQQRMLAYERFRQVAEHDGTSYRWVDDPDFNLDRHLRRTVLSGRGDKAELERFVADLASTPLNPTHPLWDMHLVDTTMGGQALVIRFHHCIADGIALVSVIMSLADEDAPLPAPPPHDEEDEHHEHSLTELWHPLTQVVQASWSLSSALWNKYWQLLDDPAQAMKYAHAGAGLATEAAKLLMMPNDSATRFKGTPGRAKRVSWSDPLPLPEVKTVSKVLGCSINDLLLSSVAGALRAYLIDCGDPVDDVEIRALVPVNLRRPEDTGTLGNHFGLVTLVLPLGIANPLARLYETHNRMLALKESYLPLLTLAVLGAIGWGPRLMQEEVLNFIADKATAVMTNVPGPRQPLYLAGARIRQPFFWVPQSGNIGMGVSILSYDQQVQFGLITDRGMVPDPERIVERFAQEFQKLTMLVLMEPWEYLGDPELVAAHQAPYGPVD